MELIIIKYWMCGQNLDDGKYSLIYLMKYDIKHKRDRLSGGIKSRYELSKSIGKYFNIAISLSLT